MPDFPRDGYRYPPAAGTAQPEEDRHYRGGGPATPWSSASPGQSMASVHGLSLEPSRRPSGLPTAHAPSPAAFSQELSAGPGPPIQTGPPAPDDPPPLPEVEPSGIPALGQPTEGPPTHHNGDHGRLPHRMGGGGGSLHGPQCLWGLVPLQGTPPYQCARVSGCHSVTPSLPPPCPSPHCPYLHGHRHGGSIYI